MSIKALRGHIEAARRLEEGLSGVVMTSVRENEQQIVQLNTEVQLFGRGIDGRGQRLQPPYSEAYARRKRRLGLPVDRVTLRLTGDYHKATYLDFGQEDFALRNDNYKHRFLAKRYGEAIIMLTVEHKRALPDLLRDSVLREARRVYLRR